MKKLVYSCIIYIVLTFLETLPLYYIPNATQQHEQDSYFMTHSGTWMAFGFQPIFIAKMLHQFILKQMSTLYLTAAICLVQACLHFPLSLLVVGLLQCGTATALCYYLENTRWGLASGHSVLLVVHTAMNLVTHVRPLHILMLLLLIYLKTIKLTIPLSSSSRKQRVKQGFPIQLFYNNTTVIFLFQALQHVVAFLWNMGVGVRPEGWLWRVTHVVITHVAMQLIAKRVPELTKTSANHIFALMKERKLFVRGHRQREGKRLIHKYIRQASVASTLLQALLLSVCGDSVTTMYMTICVIDDAFLPTNKVKTS